MKIARSKFARGALALSLAGATLPSCAQGGSPGLGNNVAALGMVGSVTACTPPPDADEAVCLLNDLRATMTFDTAREQYNHLVVDGTVDARVCMKGGVANDDNIELDDPYTAGACDYVPRVDGCGSGLGFVWLIADTASTAAICTSGVHANGLSLMDEDDYLGKRGGQPCDCDATFPPGFESEFKCDGIWVSKRDPLSGVEMGRYWIGVKSQPNGMGGFNATDSTLNPRLWSLVVDCYDNAYVVGGYTNFSPTSAKNYYSIVAKIAGRESNCVDRDFDGCIDTSGGSGPCAAPPDVAQDCFGMPCTA